MKAADPISGRSFRPLSLHVPEPRFRPGDAVDYSDLRIDPAGAVQRPPIDASARGMSDLAYALVRVLDDEGRAVGPWAPRLPPGRLLKRPEEGRVGEAGASTCRSRWWSYL